MKISLNWLKQYISIDKTPTEIGVILTDIGLEVESIEQVELIKGGLAGVVIGEVISCEKHPDADKLKVTKVNIGAEKNLQIVCGAPNVAKGQKVLVATVGCTLYPKPDEPFKIKSSKIRGVESEGMLCAEDELGLGESHAGILLLPETTKTGLAAAEYFNLEDDYLIEIGLTPNRADAMGHYGVARDLAAYLTVHETSTSAILPKLSELKVVQNDKIEILVENREACPRYSGLTVSNVRVEASPAWLQSKLRAIGLSPINNIVDCTNFVMHELGTPLHAFDLGKVENKIVVTHPKKDTKFITLDGVERILSDEDQVISNGNEALCLAGVFGGLTSGINDSTTAIFLESAYFEPVVTRKMARRHGLNTDASFRFERGVDPALTLFALKRCASLILEVAGGEITMEPTVVEGDLKSLHLVEFSPKRANTLIGADLSIELIEKILSSLEIKIQSKSETTWTLEVPAYRVDVTREADVIEEILRIYGFNKIALPAKLNSSIPHFPKPNLEAVQAKVSEMLVGMGFSEMMNNSLTSFENVQKFGNDVLQSERDVQILNPLSLELNVMRQSLVFQGLASVAFNQNRQSTDLKLFEFGKVYHKFEEYTENKRLLMLVTGKKLAENWNSTPTQHDFYSLKSYSNAIFNKLGLGGMLTFKSIKKSILEDGLQLFVLKQKVGEIGWVSSNVRKHFGLKQNVFIADLDWDNILNCLQYAKVKYQELPKTFATRRDFSLLLNKEVSFSELEELALLADKKILKEVGLFDVYEGKNLPEGKKSYALSFVFQDAEKTLQDKDVDTIMDKIRNSFEQKLGAELR